MITGVNRDAANIFSASSDSLSRVRSGNGSSSESHLRSLSQKDIASTTSIAKDEVEYQIDDLMYDQGKEWEDDEFERAFGTFS
ncbi:MAG: hypothetical protein LUB59_03375 [Candidatus Gastranaerophilales bacterium]|nr:hypothetical protein [Candidatus Gastranaerophilales bacterium]